jgi:hypothetical protein
MIAVFDNQYGISPSGKMMALYAPDATKNHARASGFTPPNCTPMNDPG